MEALLALGGVALIVWLLSSGLEVPEQDDVDSQW